jgi:hypothetical protein
MERVGWDGMEPDALRWDAMRWRPDLSDAVHELFRRADRLAPDET